MLPFELTKDTPYLALSGTSTEIDRVIKGFYCRSSCGRAIFQGKPANKTNSPFHNTVGTPYNTNVGVQKIPDRAIWKPVVAKRNNTNPWSCSEPQILVTRDSRQVHMAEQPASRDRLE